MADDYDPYPIDIERYPSGQGRSSPWGGSAYNPSAASASNYHGVPVSDHDYSRGRGMSMERSNYGGGYGGGGYESQSYMPRSSSIHSAAQFPNTYNDTGVVMPPGTIARSYSQPMGSRRGSMVGRMSPAPMMGNATGAYSDMPPLQEYYDYDYDYRNTPSRHASHVPMHRSRALSTGQYPGSYAMTRYNPNPAAVNRVSVPYNSNYGYDRRRRRSSSYSGYRDSYYRNQNYNNYQYNSIPGYGVSPTVVTPSRYQPTVVPINGGTGGYVIVPAAGQKVRVVDPNRPYNHLSMVERLFSPSTWNLGMGKNKQRVIRV